MSLSQTIDQYRTQYKIYGPFWSIVFFFKSIKRQLIDVLLLKSYSQNGEDLIIQKYLPSHRPIFYIDIGSNHPSKFNNTYRFYLQGSRGIVIEPNLSLLQLHRRLRPSDICLNIGVANHSSSQAFYQLYPDVSSTFSRQQYLTYLKQGSKLVKKVQVKLLPLSDIIHTHAPHQTIDLLSIDTEGYDLQVLKSNNWQKYQPSIICVETLHNPQIHHFLQKLSYRCVYHNSVNSIYLRNK